VKVEMTDMEGGSSSACKGISAVLRAGIGSSGRIVYKVWHTGVMVLPRCCLVGGWWGPCTPVTALGRYCPCPRWCGRTMVGGSLSGCSVVLLQQWRSGWGDTDGPPWRCPLHPKHKPRWRFCAAVHSV